MGNRNALVFPVGGAVDSSKGQGAVPEIATLTCLLSGIAALPEILELLKTQARQIDALRAEIKAVRLPRQSVNTEGWLDSEGARQYLSMSMNTFEKYRYQTSPAIKGYKVGGKTLFKREDLDSFVRLYEIKSNGFS